MRSLKLTNDELVHINESCSIIIDSPIVNIAYDFKDNDYSLLLFVDYKGDVTINDYGQISSGNVNINYLALDDFNLKQNTKIDVNANASLNINTTYLAIKNKDIVFDLYNKQADSIVEITNNIVCLDKAEFTLDCIGTIVKGAKRSKCHQKSHCLTIDNPTKAKVLPVLNIDENDVEASHSLSSGTLDEEVLFYMQTRGLDSKHALNLVLKSYLMPSDEFYCEFELGQEIQSMAIRKVDEICSM